MSFQGNGCLHCEAESLVTADFFSAAVALLFLVFLSVSLLNKVDKNTGENKRKQVINLRMSFTISTLMMYKKTPVKKVDPSWRFKKIKNETTTLIVRRLSCLCIILIINQLERQPANVVSYVKLVRKLFLSKFPDSLIIRLLRNR